MIMCQVTILSIWSFTFKGPSSIPKYKKYLGYYPEETCSSGIEYLVLLAFAINFALLSLSIVVSFKGKDSMFYIYFHNYYITLIKQI